jgi:AraC family transcriptional activator of pobA
MSTDLEGKIILFEEVLFCSDILKNELSPYNVNLSPTSQLHLSSVEFEKVLPIIKKYTRRLQRSESC